MNQRVLCGERSRRRGGCSIASRGTASCSAKLKGRAIGDAEIESIVTQICYRAADLSYLLRLDKKHLADYSEELRHEE